MFALARLTWPVLTRRGAVKGGRSITGGEEEGEGSGGDTSSERGGVFKTTSIISLTSRVLYIGGITSKTLLAVASTLLASHLALFISIIPRALALLYTLKSLRKYTFSIALIY